MGDSPWPTRQFRRLFADRSQCRYCACLQTYGLERRESNSQNQYMTGAEVVVDGGWLLESGEWTMSIPIRTYPSAF